VVSFHDTTEANRGWNVPSNVSQEHDSERTSWEQPFDAGLWHSRGWQFDTDAMTSLSTQRAQAIFRHAYRRLMLEMHVEPLRSILSLEIRLISDETDVVTAIAMRPASRFRQGGTWEHPWPQRTQTIRTVAFEPDGTDTDTVHVVLIATGNRIAISWNGRRILNCSEPAAQSGRPVRCALIAHDASIRITQLRFEGE